MSAYLYCRASVLTQRLWDNAAELLKERQSGNVNIQSEKGWTLLHIGYGKKETSSQRKLDVVVDGFLCHRSAEQCISARESIAQLCLNYLERGTEAFDALAGSYSFLLIDRDRNELYLVRDAAGSRPLYFMETEREIIACSSSLNVLIHSGLCEPQVDPAALSHYLSIIAVPDPSTIYKGVRQVLPGSYRLYHDGTLVNERRYFTFPDVTIERQMDEDQAVGNLRAAMVRSIMRYVADTDVPVSFLSGGYDTTAIVATLAHHSDKPVHTVTIGFGSGEYEVYNEIPIARSVANHFKTTHHEYEISPGQVRGSLVSLVWAMEQPSGDAINSYLAAMVGREFGSRILTGTGGDEIFVGSHWYLQYERLHNLANQWVSFPNSIRRLVLKLARWFPMGRKIQKLDSLSQSIMNRYMHFKCLFTEEEKRLLFSPSYQRCVQDAVSTTELVASIYEEFKEFPELEQIMAYFLRHEVANLQLRDLDAMAVANGVEARSPLVDAEILQALSVLPVEMRYRDGILRYPMIRAYKDMFPQLTRTRKKMSFIVPMSLWARHELKDVIDQLLSPESVQSRGLFSEQGVRRIWKRFYITGEDRHPFKLWNLALLELWMRIHLDHAQKQMPTYELEYYL